MQSNLQALPSPEIDLMRETIEALRQQLSVKDEQLAAKDKQIGDLTAALLSSQEQHKALTDALTAAQALHAGTIQERLTVQADSSEDKSEVVASDTATSSEEVQEQTPRKRGFFARLFGKD